MTLGQRAMAYVEVPGDSTWYITPGKFTTMDGTSLSDTDAVLVTGISAENEIILRRDIDIDGDGVRDMTVVIGRYQNTSNGTGDETTDTTLAVTDNLGLEISNQSSSANGIVLYGRRIDPSKIFFEAGAGVADGSEITYSPGSGGQTETIHEIGGTYGSYNLYRRHDPDDDGTFEFDAEIVKQPGTSSNALKDTGMVLMSRPNRSNPLCEVAVRVNSFETEDVYMIGTIGGSV